MISQWNSNEFCHFWNQLQNNFQHELSTKKRSLDKNFLAILRTFDDTIKSIFIKKEKKTSTTTRPQFPRNQVQGLSTFYPPPPLSSMPILLGSCCSSFGKRGARPPREEKRRKCRFPRGQKLQPARARPAVSYRHATGRSLSFAGGRCTRSPNDYALLSCIKENSRAPASRNLFAIGSRDARPKPCARSSRARIHPPFSTTPQTWDPISFVVEPSWQHEVYIGKWITCCPVLKFIFVGRWARRL